MLPFSVETWPPRVSEGVFTARGERGYFSMRNSGIKEKSREQVEDTWVSNQSPLETWISRGHSKQGADRGANLK